MRRTHYQVPSELVIVLGLVSALLSRMTEGKDPNAIEPAGSAVLPKYSR